MVVRVRRATDILDPGDATRQPGEVGDDDQAVACAV